ncbi:type 1 fimbrial protein [Salmonella enterica]|nr:type 1 fimbrial protein [Salmonella enterica]ECD4514767.1 type 1 fimbrial protein [Salmonella enterica subsp. enterica serovar Sandiego]ECF1356165.1 type 1 fimbrial protein [Salmonella enterica subsp. enterica serovar Sandiego]ECV4068482.1 type 1 fimbrial protein [Salmonella enterica]ECZ0995779.1 type 1 fimbrial protein [Salmonella enterica]
MEKVPGFTYGVLLLILLSASGEGWALGMNGRTTMSGEVLASACSIALSDRFQSVPMGELTLRDFHRGENRPSRDLIIHLDNCLSSGAGGTSGKATPPVRVRFDGNRGNDPWLFRTQGGASGVALMLRDERQEVVYPGEYLPALYQKAHNQQALKYRIELVPDGDPLKAGDYSAALRFNIDYE